MIFAKKIHPKFFNAVLDGDKPFELRTENPGCPHRTGDYLALNEYSQNDGYTGRCCLAEITHISRDNAFLQPGVAVLGIRVTMRQDTETDA